MSEHESRHRPHTMERRAFLASLGAGMGGLAGCSSVTDSEASPNDPADAPSGANGTPATGSRPAATTTQPAHPPSGGWPVIGIDLSPTSINPLTGGGSIVMRSLYTRGTTLHPETLTFTPWAFADWTLDPANVGTSSPTLVGELRSDMTFSDGTPITAEDARFTVEFIKEQAVAGGSIGASQFAHVESVQVDSPEGTRVSYFFARPDNGWFTHILGQLLLPRHVWRHVADYTQYSPRLEPGGLVGSGPFVLEDYSWGNWFELARRSVADVWQTEAAYADWFRDDAPFVDGLRVDVFGSNDELRRAVLAGDIDAALGSVTLDDAVTATGEAGLAVKVSPSDGWHHHSFNLRRVPLDDRAFRQFLVKTVDTTWIADVLRGGIGAVEGTYATPEVYGAWRPPEPHEQDDYHGIPTPTLAFPGEAGTFLLDVEGIERARDFLREHDDAKHDYSWRVPVDSDGTLTAEDGQVLHVNGRPLAETHTDNDDTAGQGPLELSVNPPQEDLYELRTARQWVDTLGRIGIPMEVRIRSTNAQVQAVFMDEDFDVFAMAWSGIPVNNAHFKQLFGRWGADPEGDIQSPTFNPMGYTGADALIERQASMMDDDRRKPVVKEVLATIWNDAPTHILRHDTLLQPVTREWAGWIETVGGILHTKSFLNLHRHPKV